MRLDRLTDVSVTRGPGVQGTTVEQWRYDGTGALVRAADDDSTRTRSHDSLSNTVTETQQLGSGPVQTISIARDAAGNPTTVTYPSGHTVSYGYDALDRTQLVLADGALVANYAYAGAGRVDHISRSNGMVVRLRRRRTHHGEVRGRQHAPVPSGLGRGQPADLTG